MGSTSSISHVIRTPAVVALAAAVLASSLVATGSASNAWTPTAPLSVESGKMGRLDAAAAATRARSLIANGPLCFVENRGQTDSRVRYYVQGRDASICFTSQGLTFALTGNDVRQSSSNSPRQADTTGPMSVAGQEERAKAGRQWTVKLDFLAANRHVRLVGLDSASTVISYFNGPRDQWKTGLRTYATLLYSNLWPGIDLVYTGTANRLKYEFVVKPGANPRRIRLAYRGATQVGLTDDGRIEVKTPVATFQDDKPCSYQQTAGRRVEVQTAYTLDPERRTDERVYGFRVGPFDMSKPLVLDPSVIVYSGFIGGSNNDAAFHVAVDSSGNAYVAGVTASNPTEGFPATVGPNTTFTPARTNGPIGNRALGAFVAKVKADGSGFAYCGYIGGAGNQMATGIAVDSAGNAYVCGATDSKPSAGFPVTMGPKLTYGGGSFTAGGINDAPLGDGFIAKVNAAGTGLAYCGYIGGEGDDFAYGVAVDSAGAAYVIGETSSKSTFPVTVGPSTTYGGDPRDAFVAKVKPDGSGFAYCGYIGGASLDKGFGIAVDSTGSAYVTGVTTSDPASLHVAVGPKLTRSCSDPSGACPDFDGFVAKVKPDGTGLNFLGYIGGSGNDGGIAIAVDSGGSAYVTGGTASTASSFMATGGPGLTLNGPADAFVAKVKADGTGLIYNGYLGGSGIDAGTGIALDAAGNAYVVGYTQSSDLPVTDGSTFKGGTNIGDAFVAKVKADGTGLLHAGYFGGSDDDWGLSIALDQSGNAYVCGATFSTSVSFPVAVGPVLTSKGNQDGFVAKLTGIGAPPPPDFSLSFDQPTVTTTVGNKVPVQLNIMRTGGFTGTVTISPPEDLPRGVKLPLDQMPTTDSSISFKIKVKGKAQPGTDSLVFTGVDNSGKTRTATLTLVVQ